MIVASSSMLLDDEPAGQSLYGEETAEVSAESSVSDEQPPECVPFGRSPPFNLASEFFELLTGLRSKGGSGHRGPMEKKRAWMEQMFKVSAVPRECPPAVCEPFCSPVAESGSASPGNVSGDSCDETEMATRSR